MVSAEPISVTVERSDGMIIIDAVYHEKDYGTGSIDARTVFDSILDHCPYVAL